MHARLRESSDCGRTPDGYTGVVYREPGLLAKVVTTLEVLSGARAGRG